MGKLCKFLLRFLQVGLFIFITVIIGNGSKSTELRVENINLNKTLDLAAMAEQIKTNYYTKLYTPKMSFSGDLTGYSANCPLCGGTLACMSSFDISAGQIYYPDESYGQIRILASSKNIPCGSIIRFNLSKVSDEPVIGIVLDRGVRGDDLDLLVGSQDEAYSSIGRNIINYDILREGF